MPLLPVELGALRSAGEAGTREEFAADRGVGRRVIWSIERERQSAHRLSRSDYEVFQTEDWVFSIRRKALLRPQPNSFAPIGLVAARDVSKGEQPRTWATQSLFGCFTSPIGVIYR
ncbi:hypothetical protein LMG29542_08079 [Paraburkholderia humisilvae]|uniref:Uncharacterized protein n=1 Tax=Paraburkholderia humisilvae TaxID=627669 RepID=A0A6J5FA71_9BURK|nr:hypothetical protein LMG29542_08079 [Paraburkholderia humisilvae]